MTKYLILLMGLLVQTPAYSDDCDRLDRARSRPICQEEARLLDDFEREKQAREEDDQAMKPVFVHGRRETKMYYPSADQKVFTTYDE